MVLTDAAPSVLQTIRKFARSSAFEYTMGLLILLNCILLGVDIDWRIQGADVQILALVDNVFLVLYVVELVLRYLAHGWEVFKDNWVRFDVFLLISSFVNLLLPLVTPSSANTNLGPVRAFRLLRFARSLRLIGVLSVMRKLVKGLIASWSTMLSTLALMVLCLYIFACVGVELITMDPVIKSVLGPDKVAESFGSVYRFMITLIQFVTVDGPSDVYLPLIKIRPWLMLYFTALLLVISISLMNLVTAVLVENAMALAALDQTERRNELRARVQALVPKIEAVFDMIDENGNGQISISEVSQASVADFPEELQQAMTAQPLEDLFTMMDVDNSGEVDRSEFVEGILEMVLTDVPSELLLILKLVKMQYKQGTDAQKVLDNLTSSFASHAFADKRRSTNVSLRQSQLDEDSEISL